MTPEEIIALPAMAIFITGPAGTGKSYILSKMRDSLRERGKYVVVVASTGVATVNIGGTTLHSCFSLPVRHNGMLESAIRGRVRGMKPYNEKENQKPDYIFLDEVSMVRADTLDLLDIYLRMYYKSALPFGGIRIIFFGDLEQLPPVLVEKDYEIYEQGGYDIRETFFYYSNVIKKMEKQNLFHKVELTKIYRQENPDDTRILNFIRAKVYNEEVNRFINSMPKLSSKERAEGNVVYLCGANAAADKINSEELSKLPSESSLFSPKLTFKKDEDKSTDWGKAIIENFDKSFEAVELKVGAKVMLIYNIDISNGLYNGTIGYIMGTTKDSISLSYSFEGRERLSQIYYQSVEYTHRVVTTVEEKSFHIDEVIGTVEFLPVRLAWAITVHKSQGLTIRKPNLVNVNISPFQRKMTPSILYVATSRVESLDQLRKEF